MAAPLASSFVLEHGLIWGAPPKHDPSESLLLTLPLSGSICPSPKNQLHPSSHNLLSFLLLIIPPPSFGSKRGRLEEERVRHPAGP